jgi:hypothetical protein
MPFSRIAIFSEMVDTYEDATIVWLMSLEREVSCWEKVVCWERSGV